MLEFDDAIRLHQKALDWTAGLVKLKIPDEELENLERRKAASVVAAQARLRDGSLRATHLQDLGTLVSNLTNHQRNLLDQYGHEVWAHYTNVPSLHGIQSTKITQEQQAVVKFDSQTSSGRKRKVTGVSGLQPDGEQIRDSNHPPKKLAVSRRPNEHSKYLSHENSPRKIENSIPQPGVPYQVQCNKSRYIPAVVLYPGCSEGSFSVENTDLLSFEECCRYDQQTNTLSCRNTPAVHYPVQYFDIDNPAEREVQWVEAANLKPLDQSAVLPVHYERVLKYMQKYGHSTAGTHVYTSFDHSALAERGSGDTSLGAGNEPYTTTPRDIAQRMAIARFV